MPSLFQWLPCWLNGELADSATARPSKRTEASSRAAPGMVVRVPGGRGYPVPSASLDAASGDEIWRFYTIEDKASARGSYWLFFDKFGPPGAPVWQSPAIDPKRNRLYFATGENYTDPATDTSDAVLALDLDGRKLIWEYKTDKRPIREIFLPVSRCFLCIESGDWHRTS